MATTKIWAVKDSLSRVVNYAENPEKTNFNNLKQVLLYTENNEKTINENEKKMYVTGVNCERETALEEMIMVQKRFNKTTGNIAYHAYQSFKTGEVTPELAHKIGVELAQKMFPEYQVLVATHFNTGTYHNHLVINSVNMFTGKKFNCNMGAYYRFRGISDKLCAKYHLTVIKNPKGRTPRNIYFAEKRGEPTKYNLMRQAIDEAMEMCLTMKQFKSVMYKKGYIINNDYNRKYPTIRSIHDKKATRLYRLGEKYSLENISDKIYNNPYYCQERYYNYIKPKTKYCKNKVYIYKGSFKSIRKKSTIEILFIALFYFLGIYPKKQPYHKPLSPEMKKEVAKLERYSNQVRLIVSEKLETIEDVKEYISKITNEIDNITKVRQKHRNKLRNCTDENLIKEHKDKRDKCTVLLKEYRNKVKIANQIIEDVPHIKETIKIEKETIKEHREMEQTKNKNRNRER